MKILVLNAGSSSLKFHLFDGEVVLAKGTAERVSDMKSALADAFQQLEPALGGQPVEAVGHRFVHGGGEFEHSVLIDDAVEGRLKALQDLAPLHMPHSLAAFQAAREHLPDASQVAAFDTPFHHTLPEHAWRYAVPETLLTEHRIRRYGFHGISHGYVCGRLRELNGEPIRRVISCHLGNGCSAAAVLNGVSIDTSMGFTPLEGLVMGSRSGDLDPGAVLHLILRGGYTADALEKMLNNDSGLKGLSGASNDMRDLEKTPTTEAAAMAINVFCYRLKKYIGGYYAALNGLDALIFTGGIGEHDAGVRARVCDSMSALGIAVDPARNAAANGKEMQIGTAAVKVWVIPTDEELVIARDTVRCVQKD